jgi:hypothetical protein
MEEYYFKVLSPDQPEFDYSVKVLTENLDPIYGVNSTARALDKMINKRDRTCEVYYEKDIPRGMIIFKNELSNEYSEYGIVNGYEEKTTLPIIPEDRTIRLAMRKKVMERLLNRAAFNAINMKADCFFGTVAEEKGGTLKLLIRLGFEVAHTFKDKFKPGVDEYLLVHKNIDKLYELTQG